MAPPRNDIHSTILCISSFSVQESHWSDALDSRVRLVGNAHGWPRRPLASGMCDLHRVGLRSEVFRVA
eukprot:3521713-Alexandrium_andersonii.AAC.1